MITFALLAFGSALGCRQIDRAEVVNVSLASTDTYQYPTVGGDEEGARIATQGKHFSVSEIRRDASTNFVATYVYKPAAGFIGADEAAIEVLTGSDGASPPKNIRKIVFRIVVHQ